MQKTYSGADKRLQYLFQNAKEVSFTQTLQSGTAIGTLTIDGSALVLYAPSGGGGGSTVVVTPIIQTGTAIATITVDGTPVTIYSPSGDYDAIVESTMEVTEENEQHVEVTVYDEPTLRIGSIGAEPVYVPAGTAVDYVSEYQQGIVLGTMYVRYFGNNPDYDPDDPSSEKYAVIDKQPFEIIMPSGGGGGSVVSWTQIENAGTKIAQITIDGRVQEVFVDLRGYQTSLQADIDRIYNVCVSLGSTPPSHGFADVMLTAMFAIKAGTQYVEVESEMEMNMRYFGHVKEVN